VLGQVGVYESASDQHAYFVDTLLGH